MPVRLLNWCKFILVRPVFILYMIMESVREDKAQKTRRASAKMACGVKTSCVHYDDCLTILE